MGVQAVALSASAGLFLSEISVSFQENRASCEQCLDGTTIFYPYGDFSWPVWLSIHYLRDFCVKSSQWSWWWRAETCRWFHLPLRVQRWKHGLPVLEIQRSKDLHKIQTSTQWYFACHSEGLHLTQFPKLLMRRWSRRRAVASKPQRNLRLQKIEESQEASGLNESFNSLSFLVNRGCVVEVKLTSKSSNISVYKRSCKDNDHYSIENDKDYLRS